MEIGIRQISELGNTPGLWYAFAYFTSSLLFLAVNHNTRKGPRKWLPVSFLGIFLVIFMQLTGGGYGLFFIFVMCVIITDMYLIFHLCLEGDFYKKFYYTIRSFMLGEFMASLGWQIYYFGVRNNAVKTDLFHQAFAMVITYVVILGIAILLEKRNAQRNRELIIRKWELIVIFFVMLILYSISNLSYVVTGTPFTTVHTSELFIIRTVIDFAAVSMLYLYH